MIYPIYILAEGQSKRMGSDKGLVKINDKEMVLHCIDYLKSLGQEINIITSNDEYEKFGYRVLSDNIKNLGPAQGVITALQDTTASQCLIVSCDMPLVSDLMIRQLYNPLAGRAGLIKHPEIITYKGDFLYPFPGLYSKSILPKWKEKVTEGNLKMQWLIKQFNYKSLPIAEPDLFLNVNTPEDIRAAEEKLK